MKSAEHPATSLGCARSLGFWFLLLPLLYVLSYGPAWKLCDETNNLGGFGDLMGYFYYPLGVCMFEAEHSAPGRFLNWYVFTVWRCRVPYFKGYG